MNKLLKIAAIGMLGLMLFSCEGGDSSESAYDPNPAWVTIEVPTTDPAWSTGDNTVYLSGSAFVSEGYFHGPPWDSGVAVTWSNAATGASGSCATVTTVFFPFAEMSWSAYVPLNPGTNLITVTAYEYLAPPSEADTDSTTISVAMVGTRRREGCAGTRRARVTPSSAAGRRPSGSSCAAGSRTG